jgi:hypothetical protein
MSAIVTPSMADQPKVSNRTLRILLMIFMAIVLAFVGAAVMSSARNGTAQEKMTPADKAQLSVMEKSLIYSRDCFDVMAVSDMALRDGFLSTDLSAKIFDARLRHHCF